MGKLDGPYGAKKEQHAATEARILLLRHAETAAPDQFHGAESDIGLGVRGKEQAAMLAQRLAAAGATRLYASPMRRAWETAAAIAAATGLNIEVVPELHERRMGRLSGLARDQGRPIYQAEKLRWMAGDLDFAREEAESYARIRDRIVPAIEQIATANGGGTAIVVAHGIVIRVALTSLLDGVGPADFDRFGIHTASLNDLRFARGRWRAVALNQTLDDSTALRTTVEEIAAENE